MELESVQLNIEILLHEYDTLREEVLRRYDAQFQSIGAMAVVLVGLLAALASHFDPKSVYLLIFISLFVFAAIWLWADFDITKAAQRLRELEASINRRAGEDLLRWETNATGTIVSRLRKWSAS